MAMIGGASTGADALMYGQDPMCGEFISTQEGRLDRAMNKAFCEYQKIIAAMSS